MAGMWPISLTQRLDRNGRLLVGAKATFYAAGTTTPIVVFKDYGLTEPHTNPLETDGEGTWPLVYLDEDDAFYDVRLTTSTGYPIAKYEGLAIYGPTGGGGGGDPGPAIDATGLADTGDVKERYATGPLAGWVRLNGRSIGSATSGATERANADTEALFSHLWTNDTSLLVFGGRGANPAADFAANKRLSLPDGRGRAFVGLDGMGNDVSGRLTNLGLRKNPNAGDGTPFETASPNKLGDTFGEDGIRLRQSQIAPHSHSSMSAGAHRHEYTIFDTESGTGTPGFASGSPRSNLHSANTSQDGAHTHTISETGGGENHANTQPSMLITYYIKL